MISLQFILNDSIIEDEINPSLTVLDYLRYQKSMVGTKIGCREGDCGACTVLVGEELDNGEVIYTNITSCLTPMGNIHGKHLVSIEGINLDDDLTTVQQHLVDTGGTQCGFCTVGFIVSLTGACLNYNQSSANFMDAIDGNICRCTGYKSIEKAVQRIELDLQELDNDNFLQELIDNQFIPTYFGKIKEKLQELDTTSIAIDTNLRVGGGTDLYVQRYDELIDIEIDFVNHKDLDYILKDGNYLRIGANVTASEFAQNSLINKYIPDIYQDFKLIASQPIRNIATFAGNIVNASPIADFANMLLALNATVVLNSSEDREVALHDFFKDYKVLDMQPDELVKEIKFQIPISSQLNFEKVSKRTHLDIASVNSTIMISDTQGTIDKCRIAAGGVAPIPLYLKETSSFLISQQISYDTIKEAIRIANTEIAPITDIRGSKEYKRLLLRQLIIAHFVELYPEYIEDFRRVLA